MGDNGLETTGGAEAAGVKPAVRRWQVVAAVVFVFAIYASAVTPHWRMGPDSGRYLLVSRSLAAGQGYVFAGRTVLGIPPAIPFYYAFVFRVTGFTPTLENLTEHFTAVNAFVVLWALVALVAAYFLLCELAGARWAFLITVLIAANRFFYSAAIDPLTDVPFAAMTWGALLFFARAERRESVVDLAFAAVLAAVAVAARPTGVVLAGAAIVYFGWRARSILRKRGGWRAPVLAVVAGLPALCVAAFYLTATFLDRGGEGFNYYDQLISDRSASALFGRIVSDFRHAPGYLFETASGLQSLPGIGAIFLVALAVGLVLAWRRGVRLAGVFAPCYVAFVALTVPVIPRLVVPLLPLVYLYAFEAFRALDASARRRAAAADAAGRRPRPRSLLPLGLGLVSVVLVVNLVGIGTDKAKDFRPIFYSHYDHGKWADYIELGRYLEAHPPRYFVMSRWWTVTTMLSGADTLMMAPSRDDFAHAHAPVTEIVFDPERDSPELLDTVMGGVGRRGEWDEEARFGRLVLYRAAHFFGAPSAD